MLVSKEVRRQDHPPRLNNGKHPLSAQGSNRYDNNENMRGSLEKYYWSLPTNCIGTSNTQTIAKKPHNGKKENLKVSVK